MGDKCTAFGSIQNDNLLIALPSLNCTAPPVYSTFPIIFGELINVKVVKEIFGEIRQGGENRRGQLCVQPQMALYTALADDYVDVIVFFGFQNHHNKGGVIQNKREHFGCCRLAALFCPT